MTDSNACNWIPKDFGECAVLVRDTCSPAEEESSAYVGLEHIVADGLRLSGHGLSGDVISAKSRFKQGDILFGKLRPYFRKVVRLRFDGVCSTDIWVVRAKKGIDQRFLYYWMASHEFVDTATRGSEGTKMPRAKWDYVSRIRKLVPPLPEQKAIASVLGSLDDKIELNWRMNETLEAMAGAFFKSWLVDFEPIPGVGPHKEWQDSPLGRIPKGWRTEPLDRIADFLNGVALQKYPPQGSEYIPVIKIAEMRSGTTKSSDKADPNIDPKYIVNDGDTLFSWSGSLEVCFWCGGKGALNQHLFKVTSQNYPKWFYYQWIKYHLPEFQAIAAGKATTMGHIQRHHLTSAKTIVPHDDILLIMDNTLKPLTELFINNSIQAKNLAAIRDALLPKLLSGEVKVKDAEKFIEKEL